MYRHPPADDYSVPTLISTTLRSIPPAICTPVGPARFAPEKSLPLDAQMVFYTPVIYKKTKIFWSPKMALPPLRMELRNVGLPQSPRNFGKSRRLLS